jgi:hypothetical protein
MANVKHGKRFYKQMALEVAVRNPERYYDILKTFAKFDGLVLDDSGVLKIYVQLYLDGVVYANNFNIEQASENEVKEFVKTNSHNNEWGYPTGYQAAFTRYLKTLSEFGFIYAQYNEPLKLSEVAWAVVKDEITLSEAFALQSMRFYRKSPYRRVLNDFNYFDFILKVIKTLGNEGKRLSYPQFMLSLFSNDGDVHAFLNILRENKIGNDLEKAYNIAQKEFFKDNGEYGRICKIESAFNDYGNTVFRVLQLTGFITVETQGCLMLSFNSNRSELYNALIKMDFSITEDEKESPLKYFEKLGSLSDFLKNLLFSCRDIQKKSVDGYNEKLRSIITNYKLSKEKIENQLKKLSNGEKDKNDFWYIQEPLKFEFLLSLYLYACLGDEYDYKPNYKCDTAGIPYSHAPGNIGDIEVFNGDRYWLIEATLIRGKTQQVNSETMNLFRHIDDKQSGTKYMSLVAPYIHDDTELLLKVATVVTMEEKNSLVFSKPYSTQEFIDTMHNGDCIKDMQDTTQQFVNRLGKFLNTVYLPNN